MKVQWFKAFASLSMALILSAFAWGSVPNSKAALPGTLNYVEGQASIGSESLDSKSVGSAELKPGELLTTEQGKAEVLLTPGVFLRVGSNSSVRMISPSLTNTEVEVDRGNAMIEVAEIHPENDIRVTANGTTARLLKTGLYDFNLNQSELRVFDGEAFIEEGSGHAKVKAGHELTLANNAIYKVHKFDKKMYEEGDLYRWSSLRSAYVAEANVDAAGLYATSGWAGPGWWGAGWYWDPWFNAFTFIPGDGIFFSPFGWGFYSPWWVYQAPFYGYGYGYGHYYHHFSTNYNNWGPGSHYVTGHSYANGIYRGHGSTGSGFHSGPVGVGGGSGRMSAGGFHGGGGFHSGGGGGFHGGGGGGGFHGR